MASLHMDGAAAEWYYALKQEYGMVPWNRFTEFVNLRFNPPLRSNPLGELKELRRTGSVDEYQRQFLALLCHCDGLSSVHAMNLFTTGLDEPMTSDVEMQRPEDLQSTMSLARAFERRASIANQAPVLRFPPQSRQTNVGVSASASASTATGSSTPAPASSVSTSSPSPSTHSRFRQLTPEEMADKRKEECYFCTEKFSLDHKCASKGVFLMELEDDDPAQVANELGISLHTLTGLCGTNTMQLMLHVNDRQLRALVDSRSTHSFIHEAVVHALGLDIMRRPGLSVKVANGERLESYGVCKNTLVDIQGVIFKIDCYTLPLEGFDVILGVHWLKSLGPIIWDFAALSVAFLRQGRSVRLQGCGGGHNTLYSAFQQDDLMTSLLQAYVDIFATPSGLPPQRRHDHRIHLLPRTALMVVRPYRYPQLLKDEVERQCADMLAQGTIQPSSSPFSAPVLLVKKVDNAWRFCVDYWALKAKTVKDKFPIPVVEELLDELQGACFFTKIDLRSGYHQV
jgi:hypothetical protein